MKNRQWLALLGVLLSASCEARPVATPSVPVPTATIRPVATVGVTATVGATAEPTRTATLVLTLLPTSEEMGAPVGGRLVLDNFEDIFIANGDGSGLRQLTDDPGPEFDGML